MSSDHQKSTKATVSLSHATRTYLPTMAAVPVHRANCACCNRTKRQKKRGAGLASLLADYSRSAGELVGVSSDSDDSDKLYDGADQEDEEEMCEGGDGEADGTSSDD